MKFATRPDKSLNRTCYHTPVSSNVHPNRIAQPSELAPDVPERKVIFSINDLDETLAAL
jgi:hypothetical protein